MCSVKHILTYSSAQLSALNNDIYKVLIRMITASIYMTKKKSLMEGIQSTKGSTLIKTPKGISYQWVCYCGISEMMAVCSFVWPLGLQPWISPQECWVTKSCLYFPCTSSKIRCGSKVRDSLVTVLLEF